MKRLGCLALIPVLAGCGVSVPVTETTTGVDSTQATTTGTVSLNSVNDLNINEAQTTSITPTFSSSGGTVVFSCTGCPAFVTVSSSTGQTTVAPTYGDAGFYSMTVSGSVGSTSSSAAFHVIVTHTNRAPVFGAVASSQNASETALFSLSIPVTDPDGDTVSLTMQNAPSGATLTSGTFAWTPSYSAANTNSGVYVVTFSATDGVLITTKNITIHVSDAHVAPVFAAIGSQTGTENSAMSFGISATDVDLYSVSITVTAGMPSGATFNGSTFSWTPSCAQRGDYSVTFAATDGTLSTNQNVAIHVNHFNCAPPAWLANYLSLTPVGGNVDLMIRQISAADPYDSPTSVVVQYEHQWFDCFNANIITLGAVTNDVSPHYNNPSYPEMDNGQTVRVNISGPNLTDNMWFLFSAADQDGSKIYAWYKFNRNNDGTTFTLHPWITQGTTYNTTGFCGGSGYMHSN